MEVNPDGKTVYFGRYLSYEHDRMNLGVLSLDSNGQPIGNVTYFRDCTESLPRSKKHNVATSTVVKIILNWSQMIKKLYLIAVSDLSIQNVIGRYHLSTYDLDSNGYPIALTLRSFLSPIYKNSQYHLYSLALNTTNNKIYLGGDDSAIWGWRLDSDGNIIGEPKRYDDIGTPGIYDIAVNFELKHLYFGSKDSSNNAILAVMDIDPNGDLIVSSVSPQSFGRSNSTDEANAYLQFHYTPKAIYQRRTSMPYLNV